MLPEPVIMLGPTRDSGMSCPITWEDKFALSKLNRVLMAMLNLRIRNAHCRDMWSPDLRVCVLHSHIHFPSFMKADVTLQLLVAWA